MNSSMQLIIHLYTATEPKKKKVRNKNWRPQHNQITVPHENDRQITFLLLAYIRMHVSMDLLLDE